MHRSTSANIQFNNLIWLSKFHFDGRLFEQCTKRYTESCWPNGKNREKKKQKKQREKKSNPNRMKASYERRCRDVVDVHRMGTFNQMQFRDETMVWLPAPFAWCDEGFRAGIGFFGCFFFRDFSAVKVVFETTVSLINCADSTDRLTLSVQVSRTNVISPFASRSPAKASDVRCISCARQPILSAAVWNYRVAKVNFRLLFLFLRPKIQIPNRLPWNEVWLLRWRL